MMIRKLSTENLYQIHDPKNFYAEMRRDVDLLLSNRAYTSLTTLILCCIDALAAGSGGASYPQFKKFVEKHFHNLCVALDSICNPPTEGSRILYDRYRTGFAHLRGPKSKFAIAEDSELGGAWADTVEIAGKGEFVAINVDRLAKDFLALLNHLEKSGSEDFL